MRRLLVACVGSALALLVAAHADAAMRLGAAQQMAQAQPESPPPSVAPTEPVQPVTPVLPQSGSGQGAVPVRVIDTPVQVQVVERAKTEAQYDAEQKEHEERVALIDQLQLYGALLVAVGILLAAAFAFQAFYQALTLRAVRRSAEIAQHNLASAQRAFVYLTGLEWSEEGTVLRVAPVWGNSGTTPTRGLRISTNWKASHGELAGDFPYTYVRAPEHLFLGPQGRAEFGTVFLPMRDVQAALDERMFLYVWGRATYEDVFEGSQAHFFEFCYRIEVHGSAPGNLSVRFTQYGLRNRADEDDAARHPAQA